MDDQTPQEEVVEEAVVVEDTTDGNVTVLLSLESLIKTHLGNISKLQEDVRRHKEMVDSAFEGNELYRQHLEKAKEATKVKNQTKQEILKQPSMIALTNKLKSMQSELKEKQDELYDLLPEYQRLSGSNQIETDDGTLHEIVMKPVLVKLGSKYRP